MSRRINRLLRRQVWWHKLLGRHLKPGNLVIERYGSDYGGWNVPVDLIQQDWVIYTFGVGEDVSFDVSLIEKHGCTVHAFDPTPKAVAFAESLDMPNFHFCPVGIWSSDTTIKFYEPAEPHFASYSALNLHGKSAFVEAQVRTLKSLSLELGHDRIDLMKIDIEGAEQEVIPNMIADGILPTVFCVEYDQPFESFRMMSWRCFWASLRLNRELLNAGYQLISKNGWTATYVLSARC